MPYRQKNQWGAHLWAFIHTITIIDFEDSKHHNEMAKQNLISLENAIPCYKCKPLYKEFLDKLEELDLSKPMVLFYWSVDLHNAVNRKYNKSEWTIEQALEQWANKI